MDVCIRMKIGGIFLSYNFYIFLYKKNFFLLLLKEFIARCLRVRLDKQQAATFLYISHTNDTGHKGFIIFNLFSFVQNSNDLFVRALFYWHCLRQHSWPKRKTKIN